VLTAAAVGWAGTGRLPAADVAADLRPETVDAFDRYVKDVQAEVNDRVAGKKAFLWTDESADRLRRVRGGEVVTARPAGRGPIDVPDGLIHDWVGAVFIAGVTVDQTIAFVQDYNRQAEFYGPEVVESRINSREGNHFTLFIRLKKKKFLSTVVLDTVHDATFFPLDRTRWYSRSRTTSVAEVKDPGTPRERLLPPGTGRGYMWALDSHWRFAERDGGVYVECRAVSLSRAIPTGLGLLIGLLVNDLPKDSLENTLTSTRDGVLKTIRRR